MYVFLTALQAFFERFVSATPIPVSVWAEEETRDVGPGSLKLNQSDDDKVSYPPVF